MRFVGFDRDHIGPIDGEKVGGDLDWVVQYEYFVAGNQERSGRSAAPMDAPLQSGCRVQASVRAVVVGRRADIATLVMTAARAAGV